ncbi:hypothetical protein SH501x_001205 [Pirellulaceae bacterium SH501]
MKFIESLSQTLFGHKNPKASDRRAPSTRSGRNRRLSLESLERRELFSVDFLSGFSLGVDTNHPSISDNAVDSAGNHYIAGYFSGTVDFDPANEHGGGTDLLTARGRNDAFVAKYGPNNEFLWVRGMGGDAISDPASTYRNQIDIANSIEIDSSGSVLVAGHFVTSATFGGTTLVTAGSSLWVDPFLTKLDSDGNFQWARSWGTFAEDRVRDVEIDSAGNIVVVGFGNPQAEIRKYSSAGTLLWSKGIASSTIWGNTAESVAVDSGNNIIVSGDFTGKVDFNPDPKKTFNVTGAAAPTGTSGSSKAVNAYVLKLSSTGAFQWVAPFIAVTASNSLSQVNGEHVGVDSTGNVYLAGSFKGQVDINPSASIDTRLNTAHDAFLVKLSSSGSLGWHQTFAGSEALMDMVVTSDSVIIGGHYRTPITLPGMAPVAPNGTPTSSGFYSRDIYFAEFNFNGALDWTSFIGGDSTELLSSFDVASDGSLVVVGIYYESLDFDNDPLTPPELQGRTTTSSYPRFLVRLRRS